MCRIQPVLTGGREKLSSRCQKNKSDSTAQYNLERAPSNMVLIDEKESDNLQQVPVCTTYHCFKLNLYFCSTKFQLVFLYYCYWLSLSLLLSVLSQSAHEPSFSSLGQTGPFIECWPIPPGLSAESVSTPIRAIRSKIMII